MTPRQRRVFCLHAEVQIVIWEHQKKHQVKQSSDNSHCAGFNTMNDKILDHSSGTLYQRSVAIVDELHENQLRE